MSRWGKVGGGISRSQHAFRGQEWLAPLVRRYGRANVTLATVIAIPLLANAVFLAGYVNAASQRSTLTSQVREARQKLDEQAKQPVATATPTGDTVTIPEDIESADLMDLLLKLAQGSAVELVGVDQKDVTIARLDDRDYRALRFSVRLRARPSQLVAFLNRLEQTQTITLLIDDLSANPAGNQYWSVTLDLVTYASMVQS